MPLVPGMPAAGAPGAGAPGAAPAFQHAGSGGGGGGSAGTCCVNRRFYACSAAGMASCSQVMDCMAGVARDAMNSSGSMEDLASRSEGCARKLDTFECKADSSRDGECQNR